MKNRLFVLVVFLAFISCGERTQNSLCKYIKPKIYVEKIIVYNNGERKVFAFKTKIINQNKKAIIFLDNSLMQLSIEKNRPQKTGFYLRNIKNDSLLMLGIDNYNFYKIGPVSKGYCFIACAGMNDILEEKDSLMFRKTILDYNLEYNGNTLDLNRIKKTDYISQFNYDNFEKDKHGYIPVKDSFKILLSKSINIKYINGLPINQEDWDEL
ncbi:hypothetical protein [uncultured Flavobacterium sp.]|jgi:hypothetical protein|uniref:hypothetical protein n=1 Tax=uncultured Flavobacterium sp. TaxID=165435 RepID=UPI00259506C8|nr:hypothetical protein [uncultured Flavobacterium sp.]